MQRCNLANPYVCFIYNNSNNNNKNKNMRIRLKRCYENREIGYVLDRTSKLTNRITDDVEEHNNGIEGTILSSNNQRI